MSKKGHFGSTFISLYLFKPLFESPKSKSSASVAQYKLDHQYDLYLLCFRPFEAHPLSISR